VTWVSGCVSGADIEFQSKANDSCMYVCGTCIHIQV